MNIIRKIAFIAVAAIGLTAMAQESITQCECWFDGKIAERQVLTAESAEIDITSLHPGLHTFTLRVQRSDGVWSSSVTRFFLVPAAESDATIIRCLYWFDNEVQHFEIAPLEDNSGILNLDVNHLARGEHTLSWMVGDDKGTWSEVTTIGFIAPGPIGDITGDDVVNISDVIALINYISNDNPSQVINESADFNGDGQVNISDVTALISYILNME